MDRKGKMDRKDPVLERNYKGQQSSITGLSFNPNGKQLSSCSKDGKIIVWNFSSGAKAYR